MGRRNARPLGAGTVTLQLTSDGAHDLWSTPTSRLIARLERDGSARAQRKPGGVEVVDHLLRVRSRRPVA